MGTINFSVTGEGSVEEECLNNAKDKVDKELPFKYRNLEIQKFAIIE